jgi:PAS domain S-box-containing protein
MPDSQDNSKMDGPFSEIKEVTTSSKSDINAVLSKKNSHVLKLIVSISCLITIGIGLLVLIGWIIDNSFLKSLNPSYISMKVNTIICILLISTTTLLLVNPPLRKLTKVIIHISLSIVLVISLITIGEYIFNLDAGIDQFFYKDIAVTGITIFPGRIAFSSCVSFILLALALIFTDTKIRSLTILSQIFPLITGLLSLMPILGYMYGVEQLLSFAFHTNMALNTAISLLIMSIGVICLRPASGFLSILLVKGPGGYMARRLLPLTILIPVLFVWLRLMTNSGESESSSVDVLIVSFLYIGIFAFFIWTVARSVNVMEKDRLRSQIELKQSEQRFYLAFHSSPAALVITNLSSGHIIDVNEAYANLVGIPEQELVGKSTKSLNLWTDPDARAKMVEGLLKSGRIRNIEMRLNSRNSSVRTALASFEKIDLHGEACILSSAVDITDWKLAQESILESEKQNRLANEILEHLNRNTDSSMMITSVIKSIREYTGIEAVAIRVKEGDDYPYYKTNGFPDEFVEEERFLCTYGIDGKPDLDKDNKPLLDCMCGNILLSRVDSSKSFFTKGGSFRSNNTSLLLSTTTNDDRLARTRNRCNGAGYESVALIPLRSGQEIIGLLQLNDHRPDFFDERIIPFFERLGSSIGIAIMRNKAENEIKQINVELEKRVEERTAQLLDSNKELESFAYSVSHDLRAPLRHVIGFTEILESELGPKKNPEISVITDTIRNSALRMSHLIDVLLTYSRLGRTDLQSVIMPLNPVIDDIIREAKESIKGRNIKWNISELPEVKADPTLIRLVFQNLIYNAIKFTGKKENAEIEINFEERNDDFFTIYVKDNGAGFSMRYAHKLFGVFQRLHTNDEFEGTGIGLATVKRIIKRHEGTVWAEGSDDAGATFYFTLPK